MDSAKLYENSVSIRLLKEFIDEHNIVVVTKNLSLNGEYTFHNDVLRYRSMTDHFFVLKCNGI